MKRFLRKFSLFFSDLNVINKRRSNPLIRNSFSDTKPIDTILCEKLNDVINEGILDSILPFICAANLPTQNTKTVTTHICGLKTKTNANQKSLSPSININTSENFNNAKNTNETNSNIAPKERHQRKKSTQSIGLLSEYIILALKSFRVC